MLSNIQIRRIIETGFTPLSCKCEFTANGALTVEIYDARSGRTELFVTGIAIADVRTSRDIAQVIGELRTELAIARLNSSSQMSGGGS